MTYRLLNPGEIRQEGDVAVNPYGELVPVCYSIGKPLTVDEFTKYFRPQPCQCEELRKALEPFAKITAAMTVHGELIEITEVLARNHCSLCSDKTPLATADAPTRF